MAKKNINLDMPKPVDTEENRIRDLINRRRRQVLVHSCLYYEMDESLITDTKYNEISKELYDLQLEYPDIAAACVYAEDFKDFDPSTGYNLPFRNPEIVSKAYQLLEYAHKHKEELDNL